MTPGKMRSVVLNERIAWIRQMIKSIHDLPMSSFAAFTDDARTPAAAESYLRRGIEALIDLGRFPGLFRHDHSLFTCRISASAGMMNRKN